MLTKIYDNANSNHEIIAKSISAFLKSYINFLNQIWPLSASDSMFGNHHFHIETPLGTTDSDKL